MKPKNPEAFAAGSEDSWQDGMTLRDYFAAAALTGWLADGTNTAPTLIAEKCYRIADAMLAEKRKGNMTSGLLTQKPGREPEQGQVKLFVLEQRTSKSGKAWTKIKNATADAGGTPYLIKSVKPTGFEDDHGNISFNLEIEPSSDGAQAPQTAPQRVAVSNWSDDRGARIERQHSQHMAIAYATLKGLNTISGDDFIKLVDWFQRDVSRSPLKEKPAEPDSTIVEPEPSVEEEF